MVFWTGIDVDTQLPGLAEAVAETERKLQPVHSALTLPFHISLKISFAVTPEQEAAVRKTLREFYAGFESFEIPVRGVEVQDTIVWIRMKECPELVRLKEELNALLLARFGIPLHEYDIDHLFHVTLFLDDDREKVQEAWEMLRDVSLPERLQAKVVLTGGSETGELGTYRVTGRQTIGFSGAEKGKEMKQYIVDAFTDTPSAGNPAAVCLMDAWPEAAAMQALAAKNCLSETAFIVKEEQGYHLRWFTPGIEEVLCGHATLASAFVILNFVEPGGTQVSFRTLSGLLTVTRKGDLYEMDFPAYELEEVPVTDEMERAFGVRPVKAFTALDLTCVFETEEEVRNMRPDQALLTGLFGRVQNATAPGRLSDCVSRSFSPKDGIPEDPVCGSAHCQIAVYWAEKLGKRELVAYQASARGGYLYCSLPGNGRILISGKAVLERTETVPAL